jgi:hypothetical protein
MILLDYSILDFLSFHTFFFEGGIMRSDENRKFWNRIQNFLNDHAVRFWGASDIINQLRVVARMKIVFANSELRALRNLKMVDGICTVLEDNTVIEMPPMDDYTARFLWIPLGPDSDNGRWQKVSDFLNHPDVRNWRPGFTLNQIRLVAEGVRDERLHDNCAMLSLF